MSEKIKAAIIGPGNIGTDLLMKAMRSEVIEPVWMVGVVAESPGLARAKELGLKTTADGIDGMVPTMRDDGVQICFDATSTIFQNLYIVFTNYFIIKWILRHIARPTVQKR